MNINGANDEFPSSLVTQVAAKIMEHDHEFSSVNETSLEIIRLVVLFGQISQSNFSIEQQLQQDRD